MSKILVFANDETTIYNFRREILEAFVAAQFQVVVCFPKGDHVGEIEAIGVKYTDTRVNRHGKNPLEELHLYQQYKCIIQKEHPDIVLTYTIKPNIYGSFAAKKCNVPYINNVTGLGSIVEKGSKLQYILLCMQRMAYTKSSCVFFQNDSNKMYLVSKGIVKGRTRVIPGSGVNLTMHPYEEYPKEDGRIRFVTVSRVRRDKGFDELFKMAVRVSEHHSNVEFHVVGWYEEDYYKEKIEELSDKGILIYHGRKTQMEVHNIIKSCHAMIHPSYHEGMANVLLEAEACGRPVLASMIPGCLETFEEGKTGLGFQVKDVESLCNSVEKFLALPYQELVKMGIAGRKKVEDEFDRKMVAQAYMEEIERNL